MSFSVNGEVPVTFKDCGFFSLHPVVDKYNHVHNLSDPLFFVYDYQNRPY